jgi:hypothetical protein
MASRPLIDDVVRPVSPNVGTHDFALAELAAGYRLGAISLGGTLNSATPFSMAAASFRRLDLA